MRLADYVIESIADKGCTNIFLVTGRGALFLNDAVARSDNIQAIPMHHEQSAGFAAVAYAQKNESLGACLVSTGCASTNALTAVLSAWQDGIPCVFISGQNVLQETTYHTKSDLRTYGQQEANIIDMVRPITKYATMIERADDIQNELHKAMNLANSGRKGPVWIDIPLDLQSSTINISDSNMDEFTQKTDLTEQANFEEMCELISESNRPIIVVGHGIRSSKSEEYLRKFQSNTNIPIVYTASCPDVFSLSEAACLGSIGTLGCSRTGNFAVQNSDLILIFGNRMNSIVTGDDCSMFGRDAKIVMIDIDEAESDKETINIDLFICSDLFDVLEDLNNVDFHLEIRDWIQYCADLKKNLPGITINMEHESPVDLHALSNHLSMCLPDDATLITDSGSIELIFPNNFDFRNNRRIIHPSSQGSMGFALPGAIGSYFADKSPTYVIVGDGSIMMNLQELETISKFNLPINIFVVSNNMYGIIRKRQKELFRKRKIGVDVETGVSSPSFESLAETFGFEYKLIENNKQLMSKDNQKFPCSNPCIIEVKGLETQEYLATSHARTASGKYEMRPIEDQAPFLDRDTFLKHMLIDPVHQ